MASYEHLLQEYRKIAKQADQRLVRLEKYAGQEHYKGVLTYSYARAQRDIKAWSGQSASRFNTKPPENIQQLQAKINDIKQFLESPTSTKKGITDIYQKRARTINERYGTNFTWQELANYYESAEADKIASEYKASKSLIKALASIKDMDTPEKIHAAQRKNARIVPKDDIANQIARNLVQSNVDISKLFK